MCYWILVENGQYLAQSTVIPIPGEELDSVQLKERLETFTKSVNDVIGNHTSAVIQGETVDGETMYFYAFYSNSDEDDITYPWDAELEDIPLAEQDDKTLNQLEEYIGANVVFPGKEGVEILCTIKGIKQDSNGVPIGVKNQNPILDTRVFHVQFPDGHVEEYATNLIAKSILSNVDNEGFNTSLLHEIVDHQRKESAIGVADGFVMAGTTNKPVITTKGWNLKVEWTDGSYDWLPLLKESNPLKVAEYAVSQKIHHEPAFNWWLPHVI